MQSSRGDREKELAELGVENEFLKKQVEELQERVEELESGGGGRKRRTEAVEEGGAASRIKDENNDLRDRARGAERAHEKLEKELIESKLAWANIELERDNLSMKMKERQE